jgi:hypothetical protein
VSRFVVVIDDLQRHMDNVTIGPFDHRDDATAEARRWRKPEARAMVRWLWDADDPEMALLRDRPDELP